VKRLVRLLSVLSVPALLALAGPAGAGGTGAAASPVPVHINTSLLSQGGRMWFEKPSPTATSGLAAAAGSVAFGSNVDANDPARDLAAGQSETAIAADGNRVLAAWNDATGFLVQPSTLRAASLTGVGFSADGGKTFTDLVGLPNNEATRQWFGDPTVVALGDGVHFIVGSLLLPPGQAFCFSPTEKLISKLAVSVATVSPTNQVSFTNPIVAARGANLCDFSNPDSAFLDKEFLSYDATTRTLVMSYTRFFSSFPHSGTGQIELVRAHVPADPATLLKTDFSPPVVVWPEEGEVVNQGAYPAVAPGGVAFVAWERNVDTNLFFGNPYVYLHVARVQPTGTAPDIGGPNLPRVLTTGQANSDGLGGVRSLDSVPIAGYSRGLGQDFPRLAVDAPLGKVVAVWNDASLHPLGDIWLRALNYNLDISTSTPIRKVNDDNSCALHFLPAVSVRASGAVAISWYDRRLNGADSTRTDYFADVRATPAQNGADVRVTTGATDWAGTSSLINPNFGDYTDNASSGEKTFFIWSDGRIGVPQPFVDSR